MTQIHLKCIAPNTVARLNRKEPWWPSCPHIFQPEMDIKRTFRKLTYYFCHGQKISRHPLFFEGIHHPLHLKNGILSWKKRKKQPKLIWPYHLCCLKNATLLLSDLVRKDTGSKINVTEVTPLSKAVKNGGLVQIFFLSKWVMAVGESCR